VQGAGGCWLLSVLLQLSDLLARASGLAALRGTASQAEFACIGRRVQQLGQIEYTPVLTTPKEHFEFLLVGADIPDETPSTKQMLQR
jgi:hypothetical protein